MAAGQAWAATCTGTPRPSGPAFVRVDDNTRAFTVRFPAKYDGRTPAPVVFAFHPGGMNMGYMQGLVPMSREWPEAIGIYGEGLARGAEGRAGWQGRPTELEDRDLKYFDAMMAWLNEHACFDEKRVFVWGYSAGGRLANLLACERTKVIAGAVIASSSMECRPSSPKPMIVNHGTGDVTIPYARAVDAMKVWTTLNGCSAPPKGGAVGCSQAAGCGAALTLCTFDGGHGYDASFNKVAVEFLKSVGAK